MTTINKEKQSYFGSSYDLANKYKIAIENGKKSQHRSGFTISQPEFKLDIIHAGQALDSGKLYCAFLHFDDYTTATNALDAWVEEMLELNVGEMA